MRNLVVLFLLIGGMASAQSRESIVVMMREYSENIGKRGLDHNFVDDRLKPGLFELEPMVCQLRDRQLFEKLLDMLLATQESANERPADVLAGIFICNPEMVTEALNGKFRDPHLIEMLDLGFANVTSEKKPEHYAELQLRLASLRR